MLAFYLKDYSETDHEFLRSHAFGNHIQTFKWNTNQFGSWAALIWKILRLRYHGVQRKQETQTNYSFTVLMAFCSEDHPKKLDRAIKSIWTNQKLKPNQIVIVKDGRVSLDLEMVIKKWQKHLRHSLDYLSIDENVGLGEALNLGLKHCKCRYIARMDSDDESLPNRFKRQIAFLQKNRNVVLIGGQAEFIHSADKSFYSQLPTDGNAISEYAKFRNPFVHPTVMFDRKTVNDIGGYPPFRKCQDYGLWTQIIQSGYEVANLSTVELRFDAADNFMNRRNWTYGVHEFRLFKFMFKIGFINIFQLFLNIFVRCIVRLSPKVVRKSLYALASFKNFQ